MVSYIVHLVYRVQYYFRSALEPPDVIRAFYYLSEKCFLSPESTDLSEVS